MTTKTDDIRLLPCPFCGSPAQRSRGGNGESTRFGTGCSRSRCPAELFALAYTTQAQADAEWNTRVTDEAVFAERNKS